MTKLNFHCDCMYTSVIFTDALAKRSIDYLFSMLSPVSRKHCGYSGNAEKAMLQGTLPRANMSHCGW